MGWSILSSMDFRIGHSPADTSLVSRAWRKEPKRGDCIRIELENGEKFRNYVSKIYGWKREEREKIVGLWLQGGPCYEPLDLINLEYALQVLPNLRVLVCQHVWLATEHCRESPSTHLPRWTLDTLVLKDIFIARHTARGPGFAHEQYAHCQILSQFRAIGTLVVERATAVDQEALDLTPDEVVMWLGRGNAIDIEPMVKQVIIQDAKCSRLLHGFLSRSCSNQVTDLRISIGSRRELATLCECLSYANSVRQLALDISRCHHGESSELGSCV